MQFNLIASCALGLEAVVARELKKLQMHDVRSENGRVLFKGGASDICRANMWLRSADRVWWSLQKFRCETFEDLFQGVSKIRWEVLIGEKEAFPVKGHSVSSKLSSIPDCQKIIKKAVAKRLGARYGTSWLEETGSIHQIQFLIIKDKCSIMLDTSGAGLHKRGYRANSAAAPIKETLAAAMAELSRVRPFSTVIDPFCGSGTILIESALKALNIAPGIRRSFAAEKWSVIPSAVWSLERERAMDNVRHDAEFQAFGYDIDDNAISLTLENARKAGVEKRIRAEKRDISDFEENFERAAVICNPPYGERLLDMEKARELAAKMLFEKGMFSKIFK